jgi:hypothetical protein
MAYDKRTSTGIGGWLTFFILTLAVFGPLRNLVETYANLYSNPAVGTFYGARWSAVQALEWSAFLLSVGAAWFLAWRLVYVQNYGTLKLVRIGLWLSAFVPITIEWLGIALLAGISLGELLSASGRDLLRALVYCAIWTAYLYRSERVANTYANDDPSQELAAVFE